MHPSHALQKLWEGSTQFLPAGPLCVGRTWVIAGKNLRNLWEEIENTWEEFFMGKVRESGRYENQL